VNCSKLSEKEAFNEGYPEPKFHGIGLQLSFGVNSEVSEEGVVRWTDEILGAGFQRDGIAEREERYKRAPDG